MLRARLRLVVLAAACACGAGPAAAQYGGIPGLEAFGPAPPPPVTGPPPVARNWLLEPTVVAQATITDNASFTGTDDRESDVVVDVFPQIAISGRGARLNVEGTFGANVVHYFNGTQTNRVLPRGRLAAAATLVERLIFVDASISATRSVTDPFLGRPEGVSTYNLLAVVRGEISPALRYNPNDWTSFEARHRSTVIKTNGALGEDDPRRHTTIAANLLRFDRRPTPLGLTLEAQSEETEYRTEAVSPLDIATGRATVTWAPNPELTLGVRGGRDKTKFALNNFSESLTGVTVNWRPSERTRWDVVAENRFFGRGGDMAFTHRSPYLALSVRMVREPSTTAESLGILQPGSDVAAILDDILSTRITNPLERAREVQNLINNRGLNSLTAPVEIFSEGAQLLSTGTVTLAVLGARHFGSITWFNSKAVELTREGEQSLALSLFDSKQDGGSLQVGRRLTPLSAVNLFVNGTRIRGLGAQQGRASVSKSLRVSLDRQLDRLSSATIGVRRQLLNSSEADDARESSVYAAITHRF